MDQLPKISIITPLFNSEKFVKDSIKSVFNQTYLNWELILVDDFSSDNTIKVVEPYLKERENISLIKLKSNQGAAVARNEGTKMAKGEFIAFLDSDDIWEYNKLSTQIDFMLKNKIDVCFSSYEIIDEEGNKLNKKVKALPVLSYNKLLKSNYIGNLTGIYNVKNLGKIYAPNLRKRQDWLLWLEALRRSNNVALGIPNTLAYYRVRKNSVSSTKFNLLKFNYYVYKKGLGFSTAKSIKYFILFLFEQFFVKSKQIKTLQKT